MLMSCKSSAITRTEQSAGYSRLSRPYFRNGPPHRSGADVSFGDIVKIFGFQSIRIGRWVTPAEQQIAANLFFDALCDLQLLLAVPAQVISLNESLSLTFGIGGRPGSCAYYQPQGRILALAKNAGGGSLAHEWFHAFDHYIAGKMFADAKAQSFASALWLKHDSYVPHRLNDYLARAFQLLYLDETGLDESEFFRHCRRYDQMQQQYYYAMPEEMAARAFEQMLERQQLKNSFLVSGCLKGPAAKAGLYPATVLSEQLQRCWLDYFALLGQALQHQSSAGLSK